MPELTTYMPQLRRYLLDFPNAPLPGSTSLLYRQETQFGLKPTMLVSHLVIREGPGRHRRGVQDAIRQPLVVRKNSIHNSRVML